jgi:hypothetical protein
MPKSDINAAKTINLPLVWFYFEALFLPHAFTCIL